MGESQFFKTTPAYTGDKPYIFVSYAHLDSEVVMGVIEWMNKNGYRVWYDEGIEFGENFPKQLALAVKNCAQFVVFLSSNSIARPFVIKEINFADKYDKKIIPIYLEKVNLPEDLDFTIGTVHGIMKYEMDEATFIKYMLKGLRAECKEALFNQAASSSDNSTVAQEHPVVQNVNFHHKPPLYRFYEYYTKNTHFIATHASRAAIILNMLGFGKCADQINAISDRVLSDSIKVAAFGMFRTGKSTLINSLIGTDILPYSALSRTYVPTLVKYGPYEKGILYFSQYAHNAKHLPVDICNHIEKYSDGQIPPMQIPLNMLPELVTFPIEVSDNPDFIYTPAFDKVEIILPSLLYKNTLQFIDLPSTHHSCDYLKAIEKIGWIDCTLFVMSCTVSLSRDERQILTELLLLADDNVFVLCNKMDQIMDKYKNDLEIYIEQTLSDLFKDKYKERVFLLSTKQALEGRKSEDLQKIKDSNINCFEESLCNYLVNVPAKARLLHCAKSICSIITEVSGHLKGKDKDLLTDWTKEMNSFMESLQA